MKNSKKVLSLSLAATMLGSATTAFAMPADTVVIGDKAFEMAALSSDNAELQAEINAAILDADAIYYNIDGVTEGFLNADGDVAMTTEAQTALKNVVLTKADGTKETFANFTDESGTVVEQADLTAYNAALAAKVEADYTAASWTAYQAVVTANVVTVSNTQAEVDAATAAIIAAQGDLVSIHGLAVESVTAPNNKEIVVKFNVEVEKTEAETIGNYVLSNGALGAVTPALQADNKTVILTVATAATQQLKTDVTVKDIKATNGNMLAETKKSVTFFDTATPVAEKIEVTGPKTLKVTFTEPLKASPTFVLNGGAYSVTPTFVAGSKTTVLTLGATLPAGTHKVEIEGGQDYANGAGTGFAVNKSELSFTYSTDATAPTVAIEKATETVVTLKFSKAVKATNLNTDVTVYHSINNSNSYKATLAAVNAVNGYSDTYTATFVTPIPNGAGKTLYVNTKANMLEDQWGNDVASTTLGFDMVSDVTAPVVTKVEATGTAATAQKELTVTFDEAINASDAVNKVNYVLKDTAGNVIQTATYADVDNSGKFNANATLTYDNTKKQVKIALTTVLKGGAYKLEVINVKDASFNNNAMTTQTIDFTVVDKVAPTVGAISLDSATKTIYVNFSEAMNNADIANIANYGLEVGGVNTTIPTGTTVTVVSPQKVKLVIPTAATVPAATNVVKVQVVGSVKDLAGNTIGGLLGTSTNSVTWGTASTFTVTPVAKQVKLIAKNQLQFELSEELTAIDSSKFTITETDANVTAVASATYVNNAGKSMVTVTFDNSLVKSDLTNITKLDLAAGALTNAEGLVLSGTPSFVEATGHFEDKVAPTLTTVATTTTTTMTLTFTEDLKVGDVSNYTFAVAGNTVTAVNNTTPNVVILTLGTPISTDAKPAVTQLLDVRDANDNKLVAGTAVVATTDGAAPTITSVSTADTDKDGKIEYTITFSEPINDTTMTVTDFSISGATGEDLTSTGTANDNVYVIESDTVDTAQMTATYTLGTLKDVSGVALANAAAGTDATDTVAPVLKTVAYGTDTVTANTLDAAGDTIVFTFSESVTADAAFDLAAFQASIGTGATGETAFAGIVGADTVTDINGAPGAVITLTEVGADSTTTTFANLNIIDSTNVIKDAAGNKAVDNSTTVGLTD